MKSMIFAALAITALTLAGCACAPRRTACAPVCPPPMAAPAPQMRTLEK